MGLTPERLTDLLEFALAEPIHGERFGHRCGSL
jgi:hypothetical protein